MKAPRVLEMVFPADAFVEPPKPGAYLSSRSGLTALSVSKVRRIVGDRKAATGYRVFGMRVRLSDLPLGCEPLPWRQAPKQRSRAAEPTNERKAVRTRAEREAERVDNRRRVVNLLRDDRDTNRLVHKVRADNGSIVAGEWRDPDDLSPNRRTARVIHGVRARNSIESLLDHGTINKSHAAAARRFRTEYELGEIGLKPSRNLAEAPSGFSSGTGPSEARIQALQKYQQTASALMPHMLEAIIMIAVYDETIQGYSQKQKMNNVQQASGYVQAALDLLRDYYRRIDEATKERRERGTIGPGLGPDPR